MNVPAWFFNNDKRQFLFGVVTSSDSVGYTATEIREKFNRTKKMVNIY